jgi:glucose-6-phosphate isomerase
LGVGGSSLGAKAIYEFLLPSNNYIKELLFLETIDPLKINHCLKKVDLNDTQFVIISKSGNTIETISIFKYLNALVEINATNCTIISESKSALTQFADKNKIKAFDLAEDIGGRVSVLSVVSVYQIVFLNKLIITNRLLEKLAF